MSTKEFIDQIREQLASAKDIVDLDNVLCGIQRNANILCDESHQHQPSLTSLIRKADDYSEKIMSGLVTFERARPTVNYLIDDFCEKTGISQVPPSAYMDQLNSTEQKALKAYAVAVTYSPETSNYAKRNAKECLGNAMSDKLKHNGLEDVVRNFEKGRYRTSEQTLAEQIAMDKYGADTETAIWMPDVQRVLKTYPSLKQLEQWADEILPTVMIEHATSEGHVSERSKGIEKNG